jgi:hypothetical protein
LDVAAVTDEAVLTVMLLVTDTLQVINWPVSLSDPLHWVTRVIRLLERLVNVPLPGGHGPRAHTRVSVVVELMAPARMVFTTVTLHVIAVVAPRALGPTLLHC